MLIFVFQEVYNTVKVLKRDGEKEDLSKEKIYCSIVKANEEVKLYDEKHAVSKDIIKDITSRIYNRCREQKENVSANEIEDMVAEELMRECAYETAKRYIRYTKNIEKPHHVSVELYSTGCPKCGIMKENLHTHGINYTENNDVEEMINLGFDTVPMLKVDDKYMNFDEGMEWINKNGGKNEKQ